MSSVIPTGARSRLRLRVSFRDRVKSLTVIEPAAFHLLIGGDDADEQAFDEIRAIAAAISEAVTVATM